MSGAAQAMSAALRRRYQAWLKARRDPDWMTAEEIASRLGTTATAVRDWCLHAVDELCLGDRVFYLHSFRDAEEYCQAKRHGSKYLPWEREYKWDAAPRPKRGRCNQGNRQ